MKSIRKLLKLGDDLKLYPEIKVTSSAPLPEVIIDGKKTLSFCSNNYLGLATSDNLKKAAIEAIQKYGMGTGGSRLLSGNLSIHEELEKKLAAFKKTEATMVFSAGFMANLGLIAPVMDLFKVFTFTKLWKSNVVFSDELNHASIVDACKLSKAKKVVYKHCDLKDLESKLKRHRRSRKIIVTDGVFSMDGDIAPLDKLSELAKKYDAFLAVDDAHSTGVLGKNGGGTVDHFGIPHEEHIITIGTFSKAFGCCGGYLAGNKDLMRYLRVASRCYMFSTGMPAPTAAAIIAAIDEMEHDPDSRKKLLDNADYLRSKLQENGFDTLDSASPIIPVFIGDDKKALNLAKELSERGFYAPSVRWPAVPRGTARIRLTVMSKHTFEQIDKFVNSFVEISRSEMN